jgi:spore coat protein U-like protein
MNIVTGTLHLPSSKAFAYPPTVDYRGRLMKTRNLIALAAMLASGGAFAQTASSNFTVSVTVTPVCSVKTAATNIDFGTYTPFTNAAVPVNTSSVRFQCSHGLTPQVAFDSANGSTSATSAGAATAEGVLQGLRYTLAIPSVASALTAGGVPGVQASAGAGGVGGNNSTGKEYLFAISANMPGGQAGATVSDGGAASHTRSVILTY